MAREIRDAGAKDRCLIWDRHVLTLVIHVWGDMQFHVVFSLLCSNIPLGDVERSEILCIWRLSGYVFRQCWHGLIGRKRSWNSANRVTYVFLDKSIGCWIRLEDMICIFRFGLYKN
jgi:hypothetical protein